MIEVYRQSQVLIVDDAPDALRMLAQIMEREGHRVLQAPSGKIALQIAERAIPDLILLDIQMPEMDGYETCRRLKLAEALKDIPVIFVSGLHETLDKVKAFQLGGVDYITKPYQEDELLARVRTHLRLHELNERLDGIVREHIQELASANQRLQQEIGDRKQAEQDLHTSTEKIRAMFESAMDGIIFTDLDGRILDLNEAAVRLHGYRSKDELIGKSSLVLIAEGDHAKAMRDFQDIFQDGYSGVTEYKFLTKDGREFDAELSAVLLKDNQDNPSGFVALTRDITERVQARKLEDVLYRIARASHAVESQDRLFPEIHDIISDVMSAENFFIALYDQDTDLLSFPFYLDEMDDPPEPKIPGKGLTEYVLRSEKPLLCSQTLFEKLVERGEIEQVGTPAIIWLGVPLEIDRKVIGVMALQHYTESDAYGLREQRMLEYISYQVAEAVVRKSAIDELDRTRSLLLAAIEYSPAGIIIADAPDGRIKMANQAALDIRGETDLPLSEIPIELHLTHWKCYYPDGQPYVPEDLPLSRAILLGETVENVEIIIGEPDGKHCWILANAAPILDDDGNIAAGILLFPNITALKQAERDLQVSEARYRGIVEDQTEFIVRWLPDGTRTFVNSSYCRFFGRSPEELIGQSFFSVIADEDRKKVIEKCQSLGPQNAVISYEERALRVDGETCWLKWTDRGLFDGDGELQEVQSVGHDITDRKLAQEQLQRQVQRLAALRSIDVAIATSFNLRVTLDVLLKQVIIQLNIDAAAVLLLNPHTQSLEYLARRGFYLSNGIPIPHIGLGKGYAGQVVLERKMVHIPDLHQDPSNLQSKHLDSENFATYYGLPLMAKGKIKGVLEIFHRSPLVPDPNWQDFLETLAGQAAIAIDNAELFEGLERSNMELTLAYNATLEGWARSLEMRDLETKGHNQRVVDLTMKLARAFGMNDENLVHVYRGALLHDIGKMGIPDQILLKPNPLTDDEWEIVRQHPVYAHEMLSPILFLRPALDIPYCHHEKWGGSGYPRGLKENMIPLAARIFAVVDVWDVLCSDRPYRAAWPKEKALAYINERRETDFDPQVVDAFLRIVDQG